MKRIIPFLFASLAAFAESQQPPAGRCTSIMLENGVPVFVCMPTQPPDTSQPPVTHCNVVVMEGGMPVLVCIARPDEVAVKGN
jgi:hypothetical protein